MRQRQPAQHDPHAQAGKAPAQVPGPRAGSEAAGRARRRRPAQRPRQGDARSALQLAASASASWSSWRWATWTCRKACCASAARAARTASRRSAAQAIKARAALLRAARDRQPQPGTARTRPRLPEQARRAAEHALGPPQARQVSRAGRPRSGDQPAHAASQLRDAPAEQRRRPAQRAGAARATRA